MAEEARYHENPKPDEPLAIVKPGPVTVMCQECQQIIVVHDVHSLILSLHMVNDCDVSNLITRSSAE